MQAKLIVVGGKASKREILLQLPSTIGRSREADLTVAHPMVSRKHCQTYAVDGLLMVRDLGSLNGTYVDGKRIREAPLPPSKEFTVGPLTFQVRYEYSGSLENLPPIVLDGQAAAPEPETAEATATDASEPQPVEPAVPALSDDVDFEVEEASTPVEDIDFKTEEVAAPPDETDPEPLELPSAGAPDDIDFEVDEAPAPVDDVDFEVDEPVPDDEIGFKVDEAPADGIDPEIAEATAPVEEMEFEIDEEPVEEGTPDFEVEEEPISIDESMFDVDEEPLSDEKPKKEPPSEQSDDDGPSFEDFLEDLE